MTDPANIVAMLRAWSRQADEQGVADVTDGLLAAAAEIERMHAVLRSIAAMEHQEPACAAYAKDALNGLPVPTEPSGGECAALRDQLAAMTRQRDNLKATLDRRIAEDLERDLYAGEG